MCHGRPGMVFGKPAFWRPSGDVVGKHFIERHREFYLQVVLSDESHSILFLSLLIEEMFCSRPGHVKGNSTRHTYIYIYTYHVYMYILYDDLFIF